MTEVFEIYFDESYQSDRKKPGFYTVAGAVATKERWGEFALDWTRCLAHHGVPFVHMRELLHSRGPFLGWSSTQKKALMSDLVTIINVRLQRSVSVSVSSDAYQERLVKRFKWTAEDLWFHPYNFCLQASLEGIFHELLAEYWKTGALPTVACFFERTPDLEHRLGNHFDQLVDGRRGWNGVFQSPTFGSRTEFLPLQAADLLAYETYRSLQDNFHTGRPVRESFRRLVLQPDLIDSKYADDKTLEGIAQDFEKMGMTSTREWSVSQPKRRKLNPKKVRHG